MGRAKTVVPAFIEPMTAVAVKELPVGDEWTYEPKMDGYRAILIKEGMSVRLRSRKNIDLSAQFPMVTNSAKGLSAETAILDGELVALDQDGKPSFQGLQNRAKNDLPIVFYVFDALFRNSASLLKQPLVRRRELAIDIVPGSESIRLLRELPGEPNAVISVIRDAGLEGVVAKQRDSTYQPGVRSDTWRKMRLSVQQEFVVGGYTPNGSNNFDSLLVGYYENDRLLFAGRVRTGFVPHTRREIFRLLKPLISNNCPFANLPKGSRDRWGGGVTLADMNLMKWVMPELVVQISFLQWTEDGSLRTASYVGRRPDKSAREVRRET